MMAKAVKKQSPLKGTVWGRFGALLPLVALLLVIANPLNKAASAHQFKAAITEVLFNPRTGNLEVAHRFVAHDAEHAARILFNAQADIIKSAETRDRFANYVASTFSLEADQKPVELTLLGVELERNFIWVYQEIEAPKEIAELSVLHRSMTDLWNDQLNTVNVKRDGTIQTVTFLGREQRKTVKF